MTAPVAAERAHPQSPADLFWTCSGLALQGFGGVLAVAQRELVDRKRWLTPQEFVEDWAVAQSLPGPNVINLAMIIGDRHFGLRGALAAAGGLLCFPLVIVFALVLVYGALAHLPVVQGALRGMGAVAAGVVAGAGLRLLPALRGNVMGPVVCAAAALLLFALVAWWRVPIGFALLGIGGLCWTWAWHRLGGRGAGAPGTTS